MAKRKPNLAKGVREYLMSLGKLPMADRIRMTALFDDVYNAFFVSAGLWHLTQADVQAVRLFLWNYQYQRCAITGRRLAAGSAVLDHCHRTGRVRGVVHRSANAAEGGYFVGRMCGLSYSSLSAMLAAYRSSNPGVNIIYPPSK